MNGNIKENQVTESGFLGYKVNGPTSPSIESSFVNNSSGSSNACKMGFISAPSSPSAFNLTAESNSSSFCLNTNLKAGSTSSSPILSPHSTGRVSSEHGLPDLWNKMDSLDIGPNIYSGKLRNNFNYQPLNRQTTERSTRYGSGGLVGSISSASSGSKASRLLACDIDDFPILIRTPSIESKGSLNQRQISRGSNLRADQVFMSPQATPMNSFVLSPSLGHGPDYSLDKGRYFYSSCASEPLPPRTVSVPNLNDSNLLLPPSQIPVSIPPNQADYSKYHSGVPSNVSKSVSSGKKSFDSLKNSKKEQMDLEAVNRYSEFSSDEIRSHIRHMSRDQYGCRYLQKSLDDLEKQDFLIGVIFQELGGSLDDTMMDPFGNYLCQKLAEVCDESQRTALLRILSPDLSKISKSMHGTRAIQKLVEFISTQEQIELFSCAIRNDVISLITDLNGNHVIQKSLSKFRPHDNLNFIFDAICADNTMFSRIAMHRHGCCVVQRCLDNGNAEQTELILRSTLRNLIDLTQDAYGNYVVQYTLQPSLSRNYFLTVVNALLPHIIGFSLQKFSSNVVEKCLKMGDDEVKTQILNEIIPVENLIKLLRDSFGNYVIQTCLDCARSKQKQQLLCNLSSLLESTMRNGGHGSKRIHGKIIQTVNSWRRQQQQLHNNFL